MTVRTDGGLIDEKNGANLVTPSLFMSCFFINFTSSVLQQAWLYIYIYIFDLCNIRESARWASLVYCVVASPLSIQKLY